MEETKQITDDQLMEWLEKYEVQKIKSRERAKERGYGGNWEKVKARMATDPEFAAKVVAQRKELTRKQLERQKAKMASDPEYAAKVRAQRSSYTKKRNDQIKQMLAVAKERGLI
jgi:flagellum-specific peptidoglycan hydrolase FlgJ